MYLEEIIFKMSSFTEQKYIFSPVVFSRLLLFLGVAKLWFAGGNIRSLRLVGDCPQVIALLVPGPLGPALGVARGYVGDSQPSRWTAPRVTRGHIGALRLLEMCVATSASLGPTPGLLFLLDRSHVAGAGCQMSQSSCSD